jgi:hypothetical protein
MWQGIESAPKDGSEFDAWSAHGERWTNVWWSKQRGDWVHWGDTGFDSNGEVRVDARLTHWMPPPPPPARKMESDDVASDR